MVLPKIRRASLLEGVALALLLVGALWVRTYQIDAPLADWHSWRQADTASVTREYVKQGIDLLRPQFHDLSNIPSGVDNLAGWRMVEFPLINALIAQVLLWFPQLDLVQTSRLFSIGATLLSLVALYSLLRNTLGRPVAFLASLCFAFLPFSVFFTRVILPEPFLLLFCLLSAACFERWWASEFRSLPGGVWIIGTACFFSLALLLKPSAVFWLPFFFGIAWWYSQRWSIPRIVTALVLLGVSVIPLVWWRNWIQQYPAGIPALEWLFNGNGIRWRPAWWRWLFGDRLGRLMFGGWGAPFLFLALLPVQPKKLAAILQKPSFQLRWAQSLFQELGQAVGIPLMAFVSILSFFSVIATGNVQHDYYQTLILPLVAVLWAAGMWWCLSRFPAGLLRFWAGGLLLVAALLSMSFAFYDVRGNFQINNPAIVAAGKAVDRSTPPDALVIAPYQGDTAFLFQTNRRGWPIGFEIEKKRELGAQFYITTTQDDEANELMEQYPVREKTDQYILIDLREPKKEI